ncbi:hypothetical protein BZA05DRAFT_434783 [Tricharina praecox]|uniref:uncharacterized protein n=1 Tax=Tricharina praecox TaxID=43433 RepID=UPI00221ED2F6|nr:uncharacterized protein BZA05DRAFT_434783 [Tricharina praecox]KAI5855488.1 hypothetical protein BZA05DRAFT_434783 [Tricharina praecox]
MFLSDEDALEISIANGADVQPLDLIIRRPLLSASGSSASIPSGTLLSECTLASTPYTTLTIGEYLGQYPTIRKRQLRPLFSRRALRDLHPETNGNGLLGMHQGKGTPSVRCEYPTVGTDYARTYNKRKRYMQKSCNLQEPPPPPPPPPPPSELQNASEAQPTPLPTFLTRQWKIATQQQSRSPEAQRLMGCKWVYKTKRNPDSSTRYKHIMGGRAVGFCRSGELPGAIEHPRRGHDWSGAVDEEFWPLAENSTWDYVRLEDV